MVWIFVLVVVGAFLAYVASRPSDFTVRREAEVAASPERLFPLIADFHNWAKWSPYEARDPAMTKTYSGSPSGAGAVYEWSGNAKVGAGRMEIVEAGAPSEVRIDLHMLKPFDARNLAIFTLTGEGAATRVAWAMKGRHVFVGKLMGVFMNMDQMVGKDFEAGLANLKAQAEKA